MTTTLARLPRKPVAAGVAAVAAALLLAACSSTSSGSTTSSSGSSSSGSTTSSATVTAATVSGIGTVLTNSSGMTLYSPAQEANGSIKCTGSCTSFWFPLTVAKGAKPSAGSSVTGTLATIQLPSGGGTQVTYDGKPLYTFKLDTAAGQDHGNNYTDHFGGQTFTWHALTVSGTDAAATPSSSSSSSSTSGSGYGSSSSSSGSSGGSSSSGGYGY
jgi:predicted lipoprotein with Yx(FWY)xxD motif